LRTELPWLTANLDSNNNLIIKGATYGLGLNETIPVLQNCTNSPSSGGLGECKLLHDCPGAHEYIQDFRSYEQSFCALDKFAGVCCPSVLDISQISGRL